jgi:hypothetical protein
VARKIAQIPFTEYAYGAGFVLKTFAQNKFEKVAAQAPECCLAEIPCGSPEQLGDS